MVIAMKRKIHQWAECVPSVMVNMSKASIYHAINDAREDILALHEEVLRLREALKTVSELYRHAEALAEALEPFSKFMEVWKNGIHSGEVFYEVWQKGECTQITREHGEKAIDALTNYRSRDE